MNILPGTILQGEFSEIQHLTGPHQEDMSHKRLTYLGPCSSADFKCALNAGLFDKIEDGFEINLAYNQKHIPIGHSINRSIITIKAKPEDVEIVDDAYKPGKIKLNFKDSSGQSFRYISITDLGFYAYAENCYKNNTMHNLNSFISSQSEIYLRIGLGRRWSNGNIEGYWMQVNGLYTFPDYHHEIRCYR